MARIISLVVSQETHKQYELNSSIVHYFVLSLQVHSIGINTNETRHDLFRNKNAFESITFNNQNKYNKHDIIKNIKIQNISLSRNKNL